MKKLLALALNIIGYTLCCLAIVVVLNSYIQREWLGVQQPLLFGYGYATVETGSMEPSIPTGSFIVIKKTNDYQKGDVITYVDYRGLSITHRVTDVSNGRIIAKGDANVISDPSFMEDAVVGEVIYHIPRLGFLINILKTPVIMTILFVLLMLCFLWDIVVGVFKKITGAKSILVVPDGVSACSEEVSPDANFNIADT